MTVQRILKYSVKNIRSALLLAPLFPMNAEILAWHFSLHCITWHSRNFYMVTKSFMVIISIVGRKRGFSLCVSMQLWHTECVSYHLHLFLPQYFHRHSQAHHPLISQKRFRCHFLIRHRNLETIHDVEKVFSQVVNGLTKNYQEIQDLF